MFRSGLMAMIAVVSVQPSFAVVSA